MIQGLMPSECSLHLALRVAALSALACGFLAGCGQTGNAPTSGKAVASGTACSARSSLDRLTIRRVTARRESGIAFPAEVVVNNRGKVKVIAELLCNLPPIPSGFPSGVLHCPPALGVDYQFRFLAPSQGIRPISLQASGCQEVRGVGTVRWAARVPRFWEDIGDAAGVPNASLQTFSAIR
jgi:hypothetical protein